MAALLKPGDTILGLDLAHGGHLTHGMRLNARSSPLYIVQDPTVALRGAGAATFLLPVSMTDLRVNCYAP